MSPFAVISLSALLVSMPLQAHLVLVDPAPRSTDDDLTTEPCGGIPAGPPTASYKAGSDIDVSFYLSIKHVRTTQAFISYDGFATRTRLGATGTPEAGNYTMTVPLPRKPLGPAVLQVTHGIYFSCADITLSEGDPFTINPGFNDAWFNPQTDGQGFLIAVFPGTQQLFLAWFTFDTERPPEDVNAMLGDPGHRWLTAIGPYEGDTAKLEVYLTEGGVFDSATPPAKTDPDAYGSMTVEFLDCTRGIISYEIPSLGLSGEIPIERIVPDNVELCEMLSSP